MTDQQQEGFQIEVSGKEVDDAWKVKIEAPGVTVKVSISSVGFQIADQVLAAVPDAVRYISERYLEEQRNGR